VGKNNTYDSLPVILLLCAVYGAVNTAEFIVEHLLPD
jgi:hypothetical protein